MNLVFVSMGAENRASSRLRVYGWLPHLERAGYRCRVLPYHSLETSVGDGWIARRSPRLAAFLRGPALWRRVRSAAESADWVIFQEVLPPRSLLRSLREQGVRIGFDFSDPVHLANGPDHTLRHRITHQLLSLPRFRAMLDAAEWATIENDALRGLVRDAGTRVEVMRGPVDSDVYVPIERDPGAGPVVLGWAGSFGTLGFLEPVFPVLSDLAKRGHDIELVVFGVRDRIQIDDVPVRVVPWTLEAEPRVIAGFDIGLAPLPDTPWTRFRGGAKLILYQSCGIPTLASPTGIGDQVHRSGVTGILESDLGAWGARLEALIVDGEQRRHMGTAARKQAVSRYSYHAYLPLYRELLGEASEAHARTT